MKTKSVSALRTIPPPGLSQSAAKTSDDEDKAERKRRVAVYRKAVKEGYAITFMSRKAN